MAQTGFTPIQIYSSSTTGNTPAAADLLNSSGGSELAINIFDGKLFYKDSSNNVQVIGWKVVPVSAGGTGQTSYTDGQLLIGNSTGNTLSKATLTAGTGIGVSNGAGAITINNTLPDQTVVLSNGTGISVTGTYPNFTITNTSPSSGGTVTSVTGTSPVVSSGGTTPAISLATAYGDTLNPYASKTANYFLAAPNGSTGAPTFRAMVAADVPALAYVTSVAALTLGTTGTDLSSTVANGTTTPVITLNVPTASATNRGALSAADWTTFNGKAPGVTFTTNYIPYGQGTTTLNQSAGLQFDGTNFTTTGYATATSFRPSSTTVPTNGLYLPATNSVGIATNSTERMRIDASGNLGLGVTPSAWNTAMKAVQLQSGQLYASSGSSIIVGQNFYNSTSAVNTYSTTAAASYYQQTSGFHYWGIAASGTAGTAVTFAQAMALDNSGNFYVGTVGNGITGWNVSKSIILSSDYSANGAFSVNSTNSTGVQYFMGFGVGGTVRGSISATTLGTTYATTSDYRLKENIAPLTNALAAVQALKPVTYTWKETKENAQGFIAHELAEVCPQAVAGEKDAVDNDGNPKYQGIDTSFLVVTLTAAIQEQQTLITNLTTRLEALEKGTL